MFLSGIYSCYYSSDYYYYYFISYHHFKYIINRAKTVEADHALEFTTLRGLHEQVAALQLKISEQEPKVTF